MCRCYFLSFFFGLLTVQKIGSLLKNITLVDFLLIVSTISFGRDVLTGYSYTAISRKVVGKSARNCVATWTFREKKQQEVEFFSTKFYCLHWESERQQTKETNFVGKTTWKFYIGGEKMRNASGQQGETSKVKMIDSEKKVNKNTSNKIFGEHIRRYHILFPWNV